MYRKLWIHVQNLDKVIAVYLMQITVGQGTHITTRFPNHIIGPQVFAKHIIFTCNKQRRKEMFYLTMHSTHFIYSYMASDIWLRTILIVRKETRCRHIGCSFRLTARFFLYAPSHTQDSTYHGVCYTSRGALAFYLQQIYTLL